MARADRAFTMLVAVALVSSAVLVALLLTLLPHLERLVVSGAADVSDVVAVLVLFLAALGIALGLAALLRQLIATALLIRRLLGRRIPVPAAVRVAAHEAGLAGRIDVVEDARAFSFCYWFLRPRICLSTALVGRMEPDELTAVLLHERCHLRRRDPLRLVVARYFAAGLYVIPLVEELLAYYTLEKELEADQDAVAELGSVGPLARALYKVLPDADDVSLGLLVPVGSLSVTEARIDQLVEGREVPLRLSPAAVALSAGALIAAAVLAAGHAPLSLVALPAALAAPGLLLAPASLLFAAAISGGSQQLRAVISRR
ncbi:MAG TPA: M56 family metallopeptidase [Candidatus Limnocylindrales bacterium]|nr:M56 family metallopeptidase [Candidatus Limnocylindrales bacterium]